MAVFDHKRALRALLDGDERQGIIVANALIDALPHELGYSDMSSDDVAALIIDALAPRKTYPPTEAEESVGE